MVSPEQSEFLFWLRLAARMRRPFALVFFFFWFTAATPYAQRSYQGPQAAYQGETVTAVDLVANPHVNVKPFRALVTQKPGEPYSEQDVQASVAALEKTGKFGKVNVNVTPETRGLRLSFILEPAY